MPRKTDPPMSQEEQSQRFLEAARDIEADGGLSPTEAGKALSALLDKAAVQKGGAYAPTTPNRRVKS